MRPTELALPDDILHVAGQSIAAEHAREGVAQDGLQHVRAAGHGDPIKDERAGHERPQPSFVAIRAVSGLVGIDDRFLRQCRFELGVGRRDRRTGFFPRGARAAQTDRDLQGPGEKALHHQSRHAADHRQVRNQRGELRAELAHDLVGQRRLRRPAAGPTPPLVALIFRDVGVNRWQLGHLMPTRGAQVVGRMQRVLAMTAARRLHVLDGVHAFRRHQRAPVPRMSRLRAPLAPALLPASAQTLFARQPIGRGRLRGRRRILLAQRELTPQVRDLLLRQLLRLLGHLLAQALVFALQPFNRRRIAPLRHVLHSTPLASAVQDPLNCYAAFL